MGGGRKLCILKTLRSESFFASTKTKKDRHSQRSFPLSEVLPLSAVVAPLCLSLSTSPYNPLAFTLPCPCLVVSQSLTFIVSLPSSLSFFPPHLTFFIILSRVLAVTPSLSHTSHSCAKCLFIRLNRVCLFGDRSEYILVKTRQRQDKHQTAWKWSWQGRQCHSYFTVLCRRTTHALILTVCLFIFASHTNIHCVWGFDSSGS